MSGGSFNYGQHAVNNLASEIEGFFDTDESSGYSQEFKEKSLIVAEKLKKLARLANIIDYVVRGDSGEERLFEAMKDESL